MHPRCSRKGKVFIHYKRINVFYVCKMALRRSVGKDPLWRWPLDVQNDDLMMICMSLHRDSPRLAIVLRRVVILEYTKVTPGSSFRSAFGCLLICIEMYVVLCLHAHQMLWERKRSILYQQIFVLYVYKIRLRRTKNSGKEPHVKMTTRCTKWWHGDDLDEPPSWFP